MVKKIQNPKPISCFSSSYQSEAWPLQSDINVISVISVLHSRPQPEAWSFLVSGLSFRHSVIWCDYVLARTRPWFLCLADAVYTAQPSVPGGWAVPRRTVPSGCRPPPTLKAPAVERRLRSPMPRHRLGTVRLSPPQECRSFLEV